MSPRTPLVTESSWLSRGSRTDLVERAARTGLRVGGAVDEAVDAGRHQRAGAHRARLEGHDHGRSLETPGARGRPPRRAGPGSRRGPSGRPAARARCGGRRRPVRRRATTAPTGTSPWAGRPRASSRARRMAASSSRGASSVVPRSRGAVHRALGRCSRGGRSAGAWTCRTAGTLDAERVGFEPTVSFPTHDFQSCRFGRSRTPPGAARGSSQAGYRLGGDAGDPCGGRVLRNGRP